MFKTVPISSNHFNPVAISPNYSNQLQSVAFGDVGHLRLVTILDVGDEISMLTLWNSPWLLKREMFTTDGHVTVKKQWLLSLNKINSTGKNLKNK